MNLNEEKEELDKFISDILKRPEFSGISPRSGTDILLNVVWVGFRKHKSNGSWMGWLTFNYSPKTQIFCRRHEEYPVIHRKFFDQYLLILHQSEQIEELQKKLS